MARRPAELRPRDRGIGDHSRHVAGPARSLDHGEIDAGDAADRIDHLADREAVAIAAIGDEARPAGPQIGERVGMGIGEVADMDVVAHAGAIGRVVISAEDLDLRALAERGLAGDLDEMGGALGRLARAALRIGAGDVEIAQRHIAEIVGARRVVEHPLRHQLGAAIGRERRRRRGLDDRLGSCIAIDGSGRGEDEMANAAFDRCGDQAARFDGVVLIIAERIGHGFGNDDRACEVDDGIHVVVEDQLLDETLVADVSDDELRLRSHRPGEAGGQAIEHDHAFAGVDQPPDHVAADIASAARHKYRHMILMHCSALIAGKASHRIATDPLHPLGSVSVVVRIATIVSPIFFFERCS